ncbi:hypothetical protein QBC42DRAFT_275152 [Cladorrhinum samala]|uniref:Uncharacterized protein n=1 Tax=Cladorrhinum samala TaxID=585594 RepID=A0AAV9HHH4_9PEZI|nr:hypothetical protein QBC42DRAFT_275152 [Cladorrhinum samala]
MTFLKNRRAVALVGTLSLVLLAGWSLVSRLVTEKKQRPSQKDVQTPTSSTNTSSSSSSSYPSQIDISPEPIQVSKQQRLPPNNTSPTDHHQQPEPESEPPLIPWRRPSSALFTFPPRTRTSLSSSVLGRKGSTSSASTSSWGECCGGSEGKVGTAGCPGELVLVGVGGRFVVCGDEE